MDNILDMFNKIVRLYPDQDSSPLQNPCQCCDGLYTPDELTSYSGRILCQDCIDDKYIAGVFCPICDSGSTYYSNEDYDPCYLYDCQGCGHQWGE